MKLPEAFAMENVSEAKLVVGMTIRRSKKGLMLSQEKYVKNVLTRLNMDNAKRFSSDTPFAGQFNYPKINHYRQRDVKYVTLDIIHAMEVTSIFLSKLGKELLETVLKRHLKFKIIYIKNSHTR
ncbi:unnamed protein product [Arabidopsis thaliana]|uniref:Reverse transcriptase Ty1/copia-type domain-containing protein n=1 Tax=Arabidopsis thaliana TaxID=3702 RepID=A0A654FR34_ARATH|nr:unnamed protein product [Arabidopsis thaliana]VYS63327.1 unnamed protein product [Arabidopsis thaliana]